MRGAPEPWVRPDGGAELSNAHIELMLIQLVGPKNPDQVVLLMKQIRMEKHPEDINMSLAADYIRRWKDVARWGRRHLP